MISDGMMLNSNGIMEHFDFLKVLHSVMQQKSTGSFGFLQGASVTVKQPSTLLNVCTFKIKSSLKHFKSLRMAPQHTK